MNKDKIGIGIITCNRLDNLVNLYISLGDVIDKYKLVIINDGNPLNFDKENNFQLSIPDENITETSYKEGVGKSKNKALKHLLDEGCENIFLLEDDIIIKDTKVFEKYIEASKVSGIQHFNFAFHGTDNYRYDGSPAVKLKVEYNKDITVCLYPNVYGAFSYYTRHSLEERGLMDEFYYNAVEHVDHTYAIIQGGMHPPFRWFADIADSNKYIQEVDYNHAGSEIRRDKNWIENFHKSADYFLKKNNFDIRNPTAPVASKEETVISLKEIKKKYGQG
jgi:GT2 family glycosyltransferase